MIAQKNESDAGYENSAAHETPGLVLELTIARYFTTLAGNGSLSHDAPLWPQSADLELAVNCPG